MENKGRTYALPEALREKEACGFWEGFTFNWSKYSTA
jgi:hypothetical protein